MSAILVTGGAGFVGSHFARAAHDAGREIVVLDDLSGGAPATLPRGVELVVGDVGDVVLVRRILHEREVGVVAHFAGKIQVGESVRAPDVYFEANVVQSLRLLEAMRDEGVSACLFSSSAAVYGNPTIIPIPERAEKAPVNPYGASKLAVEYVLDGWGHAFGLRWCALRYFNAAGAHPDGSLREQHAPETHLIPLVLDAGLGAAPPVQLFGQDYDTPDGTCIRDYIHVLDLAAAHLRALELLERGQSPGPLNLGSGRGYSVREVIDTASELLGRRVPVVAAARRAGDPARLVADPSLSRAVLAWTPTHSALETILDDALRSRNGARRRSNAEHVTAPR